MHRSAQYKLAVIARGNGIIPFVSNQSLLLGLKQMTHLSRQGVKSKRLVTSPNTKCKLMHRATHQSEKSATSTTPTSLFQKMHQKDHLAQFQCKIIKVHYFCVRKLNNAAELLSIVSPRFLLTAYGFR